MENYLRSKKMSLIKKFQEFCEECNVKEEPVGLINI